jgi:hypothetical protein
MCKTGYTERSYVLYRKERPPGFVGIDVSKDQLDLACRPKPERWRMPHDSAGIAQCIAQLR